jgi:hypothetical protein
MGSRIKLSTASVDNLEEKFSKPPFFPYPQALSSVCLLFKLTQKPLIFKEIIFLATLNN